MFWKLDHFESKDANWCNLTVFETLLFHYLQTNIKGTKCEDSV